jgi:ketosteroid isomerase-like protein
MVLRMLHAYNAGDMDAFMEFFAADIETIPDASGGWPESRPFRGRDEWRTFIEDASSAWIDARWDTTEAFALGADRVVHRGPWGGEGAASGIDTVSSLTGIFTIRDGLIARAEYYFDHHRALKAVGLEA